MHYRAFGRTGWTVSEIGFGTWQIGGRWGKVDDAASIRTLLHAFEQGINFVDTARLYGAGRSETVIGQALRQWTGGWSGPCCTTAPVAATGTFPGR